MTAVRESGSELVTVRPPDERLWLVAILEHPKLTRDRWTAAAIRRPSIHSEPAPRLARITC